MRVVRKITYEGGRDWIENTLSRSMKVGTANLFNGAITVEEEYVEEDSVYKEEDPILWPVKSRIAAKSKRRVKSE